MKKLLATTLLSFIIACGCVSKKAAPINVNTVYPFEGHYYSTNNIVIDGTKAEIREKDSIWILSNVSLYNLLVDVADKNEKIVFKNQTIAEVPKEVIMSSLEKRDWFDDEQYVWENFNVTTNKVNFRKSFNGTNTVMEAY